MGKINEHSDSDSDSDKCEQFHIQFEHNNSSGCCCCIVSTNSREANYVE